MWRQITLILLAMALVACGPSGRGDGFAGGAAVDAVASEALAMAPPPPPQEMDRIERPIVQPDPDGGGGGAPPGTAPLMAYTYSWNYAVPTGAMEALQASHKKLCEDAGPANCHVMNSSLDAIGREEGASGVLSMRATEAWVRAFEKGVNDGLKPFGASVYATNRGAEELTAQIVDNEARLRSMTAHRDALQKMVEDKPGRLSDLLEIQQALAQAQGDIDSRRSLLAALKLRVSMSVITFYYQAEYAAASQSIWRPVTDALGDFAPAFARTLGAIIAFVAAVLPVVVFVLLSLAVLIFFFRWSGRRRARKADRLMATEKATSSANS